MAVIHQATVTPYGTVADFSKVDDRALKVRGCSCPVFLLAIDCVVVVLVRRRRLLRVLWIVVVCFPASLASFSVTLSVPKTTPPLPIPVHAAVQASVRGADQVPVDQGGCGGLGLGPLSVGDCRQRVFYHFRYADLHSRWHSS